MMKVLRFGSIAAGLLLASPVHAGKTSDVVGLGVNTCAGYAKQYRDDPMGAEYQYGQWATGFLSGVNAGQAVNNKPERNLAAKTFAEIRLYMRQYCDEHPLGDFVNGVIEIYKSLPELESKR